MSKFRIVMTGPNNGEVFMDGEKLKGVIDCATETKTGELPVVTLRMHASEIVYIFDSLGRNLGGDAKPE